MLRTDDRTAVAKAKTNTLLAHYIDISLEAAASGSLKQGI